ncbi:unnamed protein product, partial [Mesorhabditis belari]|uniref:Complex 1 LYR protein domain-containing protein n=1 Tax=Mesorhabditis belari TaxID=2138241 RepID=A0AAF3EUG8_9BILA
MSSAISRANWVTLYKNLQREAAKFPQYNYRAFFQRRIRDYFVKNRSVADPKQLEALYKEGQRNLEVIRRQATINSLYPHQKTAVEATLQH